MRIAICGYAQHGKTTAGEMLAKMTGGRMGNVSDVLIEMYSDTLYTPVDTILANKHIYRDMLFVFGRGVESVDPAYFFKELAKRSANIVCGVRTKDELKAAREANLFDLYLWITRIGYPKSTDLDISPADCDAEIRVKDGDLQDMERQLTEILKGRK